MKDNTCERAIVIFFKGGVFSEGEGCDDSMLSSDGCRYAAYISSICIFSISIFYIYVFYIYILYLDNAAGARWMQVCGARWMQVCGARWMQVCGVADAHPYVLYHMHAHPDAET
jgi:hypothetical protein